MPAQPSLLPLLAVLAIQSAFGVACNAPKTIPSDRAIQTLSPMSSCKPAGTALLDIELATAKLEEEEYSQTAQSVTDRLRDILGATRGALHPDQRAAVADLDVVMNHTDKKHFLCVITPYPSPEIHFSWQTHETLKKVAFATAMSPLIDARYDGDWQEDYFLYMRRVEEKGIIVHPAYAAGLPTFLEERYGEISDKATEILYAMWLFIIAHEVGHIVLHHPADARNIEHETAADNFAFDIGLVAGERLVELGVFKQWGLTRFRQVVVVGAISFFHWWVVSMEGSGRSLMTNTHPPNHDRAARCADYITKRLSSLGADSSSLQILTDFAAATIDLMRHVEANPDSYFATLNLKAAGMCPYALRVREVRKQ